MKTHAELCKEVIEPFISDGLGKRLSGKIQSESEDALNKMLAVLANVGARLSAAFVMNQLRNGMEPEQATEQSVNIVDAMSKSFDNMLTAELSALLTKIEAAVAMEEKKTGKNTTTH